MEAAPIRQIGGRRGRMRSAAVFAACGLGFLLLRRMRVWLPYGVIKASVIGRPFVGALVVLAFVAVARLANRGRRSRGHTKRQRRTSLAGMMGSALGALLLATAAFVNSWFGYLPSVGSLLGQRAHDQASAATVLGLERASIERAALPLTPPAPSSVDQIPPPTVVTRRPHRAPARKAPAHGVVEKVAIPGATSHFKARPAEIYLPAAWFARPRPALPVVLLLHGTPGTPEDWSRAGEADVVADRWASLHGGLAPIIVMPDVNGSFFADTECVDGAAGNAETYLASDVPAWVVSHLGASPSRSAWAIVGSSEGGYCALDLGLRHADRFSVIADFSGLATPTWPGGALKLFKGDQVALHDHLPLELLALPHRPPQVLFLSVGTADRGPMIDAERVTAAARRAGLDVRLDLRRGQRHSWRMWHDSFGALFPTIAAAISKT